MNLMLHINFMRIIIKIYITPCYDFFLQAPLAECESSCVGNSPAVEVPPVKFIPDKIHNLCIEESSEDGTIQSLDPSSSTNSVRGSFQQNKYFEALCKISICQNKYFVTVVLM